MFDNGGIAGTFYESFVYVYCISYVLDIAQYCYIIISILLSHSVCGTSQAGSLEQGDILQGWCFTPLEFL